MNPDSRTLNPSKRILLVDDHEDAAELLESWIKGYQAKSLTKGQRV